MSVFVEEMGGRLPVGMSLPAPFVALFDWIEQQGFLHPSQHVEGDRFGTLQPLEPPYLGTVILFRVETQAQAMQSTRWFNQIPDADIARRLVPFARTGSDGSRAAFWLDDEGGQHVVHLGSEGLACRLGATPLDFLCLCAIGYGEIGDGLDAPLRPPAPSVPSGEVMNVPFVKWLTSSYGVTVPRIAAEIVGSSPADDLNDPFVRWVQTRTG